jgi:LacI family transcriptional regulator
MFSMPVSWNEVGLKLDPSHPHGAGPGSRPRSLARLRRSGALAGEAAVIWFVRAPPVVVWLRDCTCAEQPFRQPRTVNPGRLLFGTARSLSQRVKMARLKRTARVGPVTIHDVAEAAQVSVGTVSKALNGSGQLRPETRELVRLTAERLRFRPNEIARRLTGQQHVTVGLISSDHHGRFSIPVLEGIQDALDEARISVFLCNAAGDPERERQHVQSLLAKRVDGFIVTGQRSTPRRKLDLDGEAVPVLYAFARVDDPDAPCLLPDDRQGGRLAAEHLLGLGYRRIAHVTGPPRTEAVQHRREGLQDALAAAGHSLNTSHILTGQWSEAWGHEAVARLLEAPRQFDAIFCGSDQIARGVIDALRERGLRVPQDIAVMGFDNWEIIAAASRPPLSTIDMNLHALGRQAGARLLDMIVGTRQPGIVRLPCSLVVRESCGAMLPSRSVEPRPLPARSRRAAR